MFSRIEAWHYKCLKSVSVDLGPFHILVGPNGSGKSTFLDVLGFLRHALETDVEEAIRRRGTSLRELVWNQIGQERGFEVAVEASIPEDLRTDNGFDRVRYEVGVGLDEGGGIAVSGENLWLVQSTSSRRPQLQRTMFPVEPDDKRPIVRPAHSRRPPGHRLVVRKVPESGNNYFRSERTGWNIQFRLSVGRLALSGVPEDPDRFPMTLWFRRMLLENVHMLQLNSVLMRRPSPSDAPRTFQPDGSNLPLMVRELRHSETLRFGWWVGHLQTILEDLEDVSVAEREEDRSLYLSTLYRSGLGVPSWMLSDGTLRLLALTLIAYLPHPGQVFLVEEPENGIHPKAIEAVFKALSSAYEGQVFLATHSPLFLALCQPRHLLVFAKTYGGATDVVRGEEHPVLREWQQETPLETLFAAGVLG